jgi:hypothetical protein
LRAIARRAQFEQEGESAVPIRPVLRTTDLALVESTRLALEAEQIPAVTSNAFAAGLPFNLVTVAVLSDADFERAVAIVGELQPETVHAADVRPRPRRRPLFGIALLVLMVLAGFFLLIG